MPVVLVSVAAAAHHSSRARREQSSGGGSAAAVAAVAAASVAVVLTWPRSYRQTQSHDGLSGTRKGRTKSAHPLRNSFRRKLHGDGRVKAVLMILGNGNLDQHAAQAAAWHFTDGMSWSELAAKKSHHLGGRPDEPYFSRAELQAAMQIATQAEQLGKELPAVKTPTEKLHGRFQRDRRPPRPMPSWEQPPKRTKRIQRHSNGGVPTSF